MKIRTFSELAQSTEWGLYVTTWRNAILRSDEARSKGFDSSQVVESAIEAFVNAAIEGRVKRFAFDQLRPHRVTADNVHWHDLQLPDWRRVN